MKFNQSELDGIGDAEILLARKQEACDAVVRRVSAHVCHELGQFSPRESVDLIDFNSLFS